MTNQPASSSGRAPVFEKFLGFSGSPSDSGALLGLPATYAGDSVVIAALQRQLSRVSAHPEALSAEADEVRLALHAAAARLLDPAQRRRSAPRTAESAGASSVRPAEPMGLEAALLLTLGMCGGWNRVSLHRMSLLARAHGVPADQIVDVLRGLARPTGARAAVGAVAIPRPQAYSRPSIHATLPLSSASIPVEADDGQRAVKNVVLVLGLGLVMLVGVVAVLLIVVTGGGGKSREPEPPPRTEATATPSDSAPSQLFPTRPKGADEKRRPGEATSARIGDWTDLLRELNGCIAAAEVDVPAALERFAALSERMSRTWDEATPDGLVAAVDGVVEFMYRVAADPVAAARAVEAVGGGVAPSKSQVTPGEVLPTAWSAGMLARLARERDLPSSVRAAVQSSVVNLHGASGLTSEQTFRAGALAALAAMQPRLTPAGTTVSDEAVAQSSGSWRRWLGALESTVGTDTPAYTRTTLLALDGLLISGPEPTQNRAVFDAVTILVAALPWRSGDESRAWLMRWFDAPGVTAADLQAVTSALAGHSSAAGIDLSMVLTLAAGDAQRTELRDRYAAVWGLSAGMTRDALVQEWIDAARSRLAFKAGSAPKDRLVHAVTLARANRAASMLWSGETAGVSAVLAEAPPVAPDADPNRPPPNVFTLRIERQGSAPWAVQYLGNRHNVAMRRELLAQITSPPDVVESEIIVEEALRGSPPQVRADARAVVMRFATHVPIINAMLEMAPTMPQTIDNSELAERVALTTLPPNRDPAWRVELRRALVERLLQVVAASSDLAFVEELSGKLAEAYATPVPTPSSAAPGDVPPDETGVPALKEAPAVEVSAMILRLRWQQEAASVVASRREPMSLAEVTTRRDARTRLADGRVQSFAAEQVNIVELMAFVIVAEQPALAESVAPVLTELAAARRDAGHVFDQVEAAERARLRLWLIRYGESAS